MYAQPLYLKALAIPGHGMHNVVFVATMHDSVYAFDADTSGPPLWQATLSDTGHGATAGATPDPAKDTGCTEIAGPEIGITSTPVIDPATETIYVVAKTLENGYPVQRLHSLDVTSGNERTLSPVSLSASVHATGSGSSGGILNFDPKWENQRAGLLLVNGIVYMAFGGYCDNGPFHGWVLAYNTSTMTQTSAFIATPNALGSGIWMSGAGLAADVPPGRPFGRMFLATGNGTYDATPPYMTNTANYGDDVVRLDLTNGVMTVTDVFTPLDQANLQARDLDLASGGVMLLPDRAVAAHTHQLLAAGKTGNIYLVDRENLGGYSTTTNNVIESLIPNQVGGVFGLPAYWNNHVYYWGNQDTLKQFDFTLNGGLMDYWHSHNSSESQNFPGSTPSISANGDTNGIVWNIDSSAWSTGGNANLLAHDALNVSTTLYSSATNGARDNPGTAVQFAVPTISNGKVYVAGYGQVSVFGLLTADFTLSAAASSLSLAPGAVVADNVTVGPLNGFSGNVSLSAGGLPAGVTATFTPGTNSGTSFATFSASSAAVPAVYPVVITGTSGSLTHSLTLSLTVTAAGLPSFTLSANPTSLPVAQGQSGTSIITLTPINGFSSGVTLSASGLPSLAKAAFGPGNSATSETLLVITSSTTPVGTSTITVVGVGGGMTASTSVLLTVSAPAAPVSVDLSTIANVYGIFGDGSRVTHNGLDANGNAYSSNLLMTSVAWSGLSFAIRPPGTPSAAAATNIPLPAGNFTRLSFLGTGVNGNQFNQAFVVTYTDGSATTFTQSLSDWYTPQNYTGESVAASMPYRVTQWGDTQTGPFILYGYSLTLNGTKMVRSLTLPYNRNVAVLALTLVPDVDFILSVSPASLSILPGATANATASLTLLNGFSKQVTLTAPNLPNGVTASFGSGTLPTTAIVTFTAALTATPGSYSVTITGNSGSLTHSVNLPLQIVGPPDFALSASPNTLTMQNRGTATTTVQVSLLDAFTGSVLFGISGLPTGITASFSPTSSATSSTLTLNGSASAQPGVYPLNITGTSGTLNHSTPITLTVAGPKIVTSVHMSGVFNVYGISDADLRAPQGGLDTEDYAYADELIGRSIRWFDLPFNLGTAGVPSAASRTIVPLPPGSFSTINFLGTGVNGNQTNQTFVVRYSDGTSSSFVQSLNDWGYFPTFSGQMVVSTMPYRTTPWGDEQFGGWHLYGYSFAIDNGKTVQSMTLPDNRNVVVLAITLSP